MSRRQLNEGNRQTEERPAFPWPFQGSKTAFLQKRILPPWLLSNPWGQGEFGLQFYAWEPLTTPECLRMGTICLLDFKPRKFSKENKSLLEHLASLVMAIAVPVKTKKTDLTH